MSASKPYLKNNRLSDVLAMIQVLALDAKTHRSEEGITLELQGEPKSSSAWIKIGEEHPEFFRVNKQQDNQLSLVSRHVNYYSKKASPPLSPDVIKMLVQTAIELHDRQRERAGWWKTWLPLVIALGTVIITSWVQISSNKNQTELKHYEVELKPKQDGYANFMKAITETHYAAYSSDFESLVKYTGIAQSNLYILEPFLSEKQRSDIWQKHRDFIQFCNKIIKEHEVEKNSDQQTKKAVEYERWFRKNLYESLFGKVSSVK